MTNLSPVRFSLFSPPYRTIRSTPDFPATLGPSVAEAPGTALVWRPDPEDPGRGVDLASRRKGGLALVVILPPAASLLGRRRFLEIIERCRPHTILPHADDLDPSELRPVLARPPSSLASDVTDYLAWRGIRPDRDTVRLLRRTLDLSADVRTVSGLAQSLYTSRRALGRRFLNRGLPVPSHWLHFGRILRAAFQLQTTDDNLFTVACRLGYPDGFALSNQMYRLVGVRPSQARECLGWEWLLESWLRREAETGGLSVAAFGPSAMRDRSLRDAPSIADDPMSNPSPPDPTSTKTAPRRGLRPSRTAASMSEIG